MNENILATAARLSDDALLARIKVLAIHERGATVELVAHLAVLDGRQSHLGEGPGSLYKYCRDVLGYSEDAAWNRAATAGAVRRYPLILGWLADGSLNITTVRILRPVLTPENHLAVLTEARRRSKREVEVIAARLDPKPDVPSTIRKLPALRQWPPSRCRWRKTVPRLRRQWLRHTADSSALDRIPHTRALSGAVHGLQGDPRQAATGPGSALPRDPERRLRGHLRSRP